MLVAQNNYGQYYKNTIALLGMAISIGIDIMYLQNVFLGNRNIIYNVFNFY